MEYRRLGMSGAGRWRPSPGRSTGVIADPSTEFPPPYGVDLTSDYSDFPLGDPNFDYSNADLSGVDPLGDDAEIGSVNIDLRNLNSRPASKAATIVGTCTGDDAGEPDSDYPDCDNLGWTPAFGNHGIYVAFGALVISPATNQWHAISGIRKTARIEIVSAPLPKPHWKV
jgi:hypothetical protein